MNRRRFLHLLGAVGVGAVVAPADALETIAEVGIHDGGYVGEYMGIDWYRTAYSRYIRLEALRIQSELRECVEYRP